MACKAVFTTYEAVAAAELPVVQGRTRARTFSRIRLALSIYPVLEHEDAAETADALAETVMQLILSKRIPSLTPQIIAGITYHCIRRYDKTAGLKYGVAYGLVKPD